MNGIIYLITNTINNKVYVGQTIQNLKDRWYRHCQKKCLSNYEANMAIKRAIFKYGKDNFKVEVLEECPQEKLNEREIYYIAFFHSYEDGYNCTKGGQLGGKPLKIAKAEYPDIIDLYNLGCSLREIAREYNVDKDTIKHVLERNNIPIHKVRSYKFSSEDRQKILQDVEVYGRKETCKRWGISSSYLSQLCTGSRRI